MQNHPVPRRKKITRHMDGFRYAKRKGVIL
nr:MAG TPA: hypothetical protein [Caudoviricetes sp.]